MKAFNILLLSALWGLSLASQAQALSLGAATYQALTDTYAPPGPFPVSSTINDGLLNESASAEPLPFPTAMASAQSTPTHPVSGAVARMSYDFAIVTGSATAVVMDISALAQTGGSGDFVAQAHVDLLGDGGGVSLANAQSCGENYTGCQSYQAPPTSGGVKVLYLKPNTDYEFLLSALVDTGFYGATASAMADPTVTFDPNFAHPADARIVFSANLGAVPEPADWMLMIGGLALVGAAMRRGRAQVA